MQNDKLLPCPFCGGEAKINQIYPFMQRRVRTQICCTNCRANSGFFGRKDFAIKTWNTRMPMERIVEQLEELTEDVADYKEDDIFFGEYRAYLKAIEIVKGGVDNAE